ncbi:GNAT family N-acetyltransferase [Sedimentitalea nanhaiensis]|uniref:Acetyltransferase (GNAT) family protein n=1 Tax=Sedimentitalea nanhaiensis TaxID=999627 RepID=A0A1I6Z1E9_9RHOB|nr:GNAT family N-acetyltransferase [Sedimentitalea nanhaiensis]SFT56546.1 Acetyltransferase (GNAT) family protein [Sedimentitalea nanhaiensis]
MTSPSWYDVIDGTWPAARRFNDGIWTLRQGQDGGSRVSATTLGVEGATITDTEIGRAETGMRAMGQPLIFMIRQGDDALDAKLRDRGYAIKDPVTVYACASARLTDVPLPRVTVLNVWEPLAIMREIWAAGGIGPARLEVMHRAQGAKIGLLGRKNDKPAGAAFVAIHRGVAMVHAVEVLAHQRRAGMGSWFMRAAAFWAVDNGAQTLSVMCTQQNVAANALYASLGMLPVGQYHYRHLPDGD